MAKSLIGKIIDFAQAPSLPHVDPARGRGVYGYGSTPADKHAMLQMMGSVGTLFGIVQLLSTGVSATEWHLYRKQTDGRRTTALPTERNQPDRPEVVQHQALKLWKEPNDFFTGQDFREVGWQFMELVGEWYWVIDRGPTGLGVPLEMWPVRPDRMDPVPDRDKYLKGWIYTGPTGEKVPLLHDEVIQMRYPDPDDMYRGMSAVQALLVDLDNTRYSAEWSRNFFMNSATPGGIVQFSKRLSDDEFDEFVLRWREQHQGISRGHRVGVLEQGALWIPATYSMRDMQFAELRKMSREVIREAYRIHSAMLGISEDVNRANAQTAEDVHIQWHEVPRLKRMRTTLNTRYLAMFGATGTGVEFDFDDPSQTNIIEDATAGQFKAQAASLLIKAGFHPDDVCDAVGLPRMRNIPAPAPAPRPALPPGAPAAPGDQPTEEQAMLEYGQQIRAAFRAARYSRGDMEAEVFAEALRAELPRRNGHRVRELT